MTQVAGLPTELAEKSTAEEGLSYTTVGLAAYAWAYEWGSLRAQP